MICLTPCSIWLNMALHCIFHTSSGVEKGNLIFLVLNKYCTRFHWNIWLSWRISFFFTCWICIQTKNTNSMHTLYFFKSTKMLYLTLSPASCCHMHILQFQGAWLKHQNSRGKHRKTSLLFTRDEVWTCVKYTQTGKLVFCSTVKSLNKYSSRYWRFGKGFHNFCNARPILASYHCSRSLAVRNWYKMKRWFMKLITDSMPGSFYVAVCMAGRIEYLRTSAQGAVYLRKTQVFDSI